MVTSKLGALSGILLLGSSTAGESRGERCFRSLLGPASTPGESELEAIADADVVGAGISCGHRIRSCARLGALLPARARLLPVIHVSLPANPRPNAWYRVSLYRCSPEQTVHLRYDDAVRPEPV